jgi:hypothetical protein
LEAIMRAIAAAVLTILLAAPAAAQPTLAEAEAALQRINDLARTHYAAAKQAALAAAGPVIVVAGEEVILQRGGATERVAYLPPRYRHLKALGHVPLGLWSLLAARADHPPSLAPDLAPALTAYRAQVAALEPLIGALGLRWDDAKRQREIVATTLAFIDQVAARGGATAAELDAYADDIGPALLGNAYDAAEVQLAALHEAVQRWRAGLTPGEWGNLHVVVLGPNRPRESQPPYLYFQRLLGQDAGARLLTADNLTDSAAALDLPAGAVADRRLAGAFFADSTRLQRGLLSDASLRHLDRLLGP